MTLKEKLRQGLTGHLSDEKTEVDVNIAAKIAEDFAQDFAEWSVARALGCDVFTLKRNELEIYKKEKGL